MIRKYSISMFSVLVLAQAAPTQTVPFPMGGDPNFSSTYFYHSDNEGASGKTSYFGEKLDGVIATGPTVTDRGYGGALKHFDVRYDSADTGADFLRVVMARDVMTGTTGGGRIAVLGEVLQKSPSKANNPNRNYQGGGFSTHTETGDGGTGLTLTTAKGAYFGLGAATFLHADPSGAGARNLLDVSNEFDDYSQPSASVALKSSISLVNYGAVRGALLDAALRLTGSTDTFNPGGGPGWETLIAITDSNGRDAFDSTSSIIGMRNIRDTSQRTMANAFDLGGVRFTNYILNTDFVKLKEGQLSMLAPQGIISLQNSSRYYQQQAVSSGDYYRILAQDVGDLIRIHANGNIVFPQGLRDATNDTSAAAAGVAVNGIYRDSSAGNVLKIRVN